MEYHHELITKTTKWCENAEKIGLSWPHTKAMLERIASSWEAHAKWEDDQAEKGKLKFR